MGSSWEAANCAATQEIPSILWNPKVHYRVHKSLPLVTLLSTIIPVHTIPSYLSKIHFSIIHVSIFLVVRIVLALFHTTLNESETIFTVIFSILLGAGIAQSV
jgi:hypothetical protein